MKFLEMAHFAPPLAPGAAYVDGRLTPETCFNIFGTIMQNMETVGGCFTSFCLSTKRGSNSVQFATVIKPQYSAQCSFS